LTHSDRATRAKLEFGWRQYLSQRFQTPGDAELNF